ncbi:unnamed protein product, partial [Mesorhabditis belari]|uniref:Endonuclease/exonuclease/phosphatase domain-containing protein n=1 Tax=Mesorhabditis belari TaxID=2138241 RepID=A0AAF3EHI3_9BILA
MAKVEELEEGESPPKRQKDVDAEHEEEENPIDERNALEEENAVAERAMRDFAAITGTDEIYAHTILQDVNWNIEAALEVHFGGQNEPAAGSDGENEEPNEGPSTSSEFEVSLMSWNIDGLDGSSLATRMKAVHCVLKNINPDFIFLQEVVEREIVPIEKLEKYYKIFYSNRPSQYFTAILVSKAFDVLNHHVHHFENSGMGRTLQTVEGKIGPTKVFLLNTHLESMAEHSNKRTVQIRYCLQKMGDIVRNNPNALVFFGGDLNIRDEELPPLPNGVADAFLAAGSPKGEKFTWDTRKNDNKFAHGAQCRFDRVFWAGPLRTVSFKLEGRQRIRTTLCFPSDHWAVNCTFSP